MVHFDFELSKLCKKLRICLSCFVNRVPGVQNSESSTANIEISLNRYGRLIFKDLECNLSIQPWWLGGRALAS